MSQSFDRRMLTARQGARARRKTLPARRGIIFKFADEKFGQQQRAERIAARVHDPDRPWLRGAKRPRAEDHHAQDQQPAQIIGHPIQLDVTRAQVKAGFIIYLL